MSSLYTAEPVFDANELDDALLVNDITRGLFHFSLSIEETNVAVLHAEGRPTYIMFLDRDVGEIHWLRDGKPIDHIALFPADRDEVRTALVQANLIEV